MDQMTTALFIPRVVDGSKCATHNALPGAPCYSIDLKMGVCNKRILAFGFNGKISAKSLGK